MNLSPLKPRRTIADICCLMHHRMETFTKRVGHPQPPFFVLTHFRLLDGLVPRPLADLLIRLRPTSTPIPRSNRRNGEKICQQALS